MSKSKIVKRERASQRRHFRISAPIYICLPDANKKYLVRDWSLGGFALSDRNRSTFIHADENNSSSIDEGKSLVEVYIDDVLNIQVEIVFGDFNISFDAKAKVVRVDKENSMLAATFYELSSRNLELLKLFSESIISGEMSSIGDTIQRLDTPVTLVSEKPDKKKGKPEELCQRERSLKTYAVSAAYVALGLIVGFYALSTFYSNIFSLRIENATIVGRDNLIKSSINGTIDELYVISGQYVDRGDPLFHIRDEETLENIKMAKIKVMEAEFLLEEKQQLLESQNNKMKSYKLFGIDELKIVSARENAIRKKLVIAKRRYDRATKLNENNLYSDDRMDEMQENIVDLTADLEMAEAEKKRAERAIKEIGNGRFFTANRLEGEVNDLESAVTAAEKKVALEKSKLEIMENRKSRLMVMAPVSGKVSSIYTNQYQLVDKGEAILVVEGDGSKEIELLVSAKDFEYANIKEPAKVYIGGQQKAIAAYVNGIDRKVFITEGINSIGLNSELQHNIKVRLAFVAEENVGLSTLPSGLPVTVVFLRDPLNSNIESLSSIGPQKKVKEIADLNL